MRKTYRVSIGLACFLMLMAAACEEEGGPTGNPDAATGQDQGNPDAATGKDPGSFDTPAKEAQGPETCTGVQASCEGSQSLKACVDGEWQVLDCGQLCAEDGAESGSCEHDDSKEHDVCVCQSSASPCESCVESKCASQAKACSASQSCVALANCVTKCSSESCVSSCVNSYPSGAQKLINLLKCMQSYCKSQCS